MKRALFLLLILIAVGCNTSLKNHEDSPQSKAVTSYSVKTAELKVGEEFRLMVIGHHSDGSSSELSHMNWTYSLRSDGVISLNRLDEKTVMAKALAGGEVIVTATLAQSNGNNGKTASGKIIVRKPCESTFQLCEVKVVVDGVEKVFKQVYTEPQLRLINDNPYANYKLEADIDLSAAPKLSNGSYISDFYGILDGSGKKIIGFSSNSGIIKKTTRNSKVQNLVLDGIKVINTATTSYYQIGGLVNEHFGVINNVQFSGEVKGDLAAFSLGGLVGHVSGGSIYNAKVSAVVSGKRSTGGVIGTASGLYDPSIGWYRTGNLQNTSFNGEIFTEVPSGGNQGIGGIVGDIGWPSLKFKNVKTEGKIEVELKGLHLIAFVGGVFGSGGIDLEEGVESKMDILVKDSQAYSDYRKVAVGGIAGNAYRSLSKVKSSGQINVPTSPRSIVGGIVGLFGNSNIKDSYSTANVDSKWIGGGLVGNLTENSSIVNSYASGSVKGEYAGSLVGVVYFNAFNNLAGLSSVDKIDGCFATGAVQRSQENSSTLLGMFGSSTQVTNSAVLASSDSVATAEQNITQFYQYYPTAFGWSSDVWNLSTDKLPTLK